MQTLLRCSILLSILAIAACGGDDDTVPTAPPSSPSGHAGDKVGDTDSDAGTSDAGPIGPVDNGDGGTVDADGPMIDILEPAAAADPNTDTIVTSSTVKVRCKVMRSQSRSAHEVNPTSVKIVATSGKDALAGVVTADANDIFEAEFNLSDFKNGALAFTCSANDVAMPAHTGSTTIDTFLDLGPEIHILEPMDMGTYALTKKVSIRFEVMASKVTASDKEATPKNIKLDVSGQNVKFTESSSEPGLYTASINFNDRKLYPMAPTSSAIRVTATSSRTPKAPERKQKVDITLDADGPAIGVASPGYMTIVRGDVVLNITVSDPAGVNLDSITGSINKDLYVLNDWQNTGGGNFTTHFDTVPFGFELTQLTINIKATDKVGNQNTVDHVLRLDNLAPLISLDPPPIRIGNAANNQCSAEFDPVGPDAQNDVSTADISSLYRIEIWERTNHSPGANVDYVAGVKDSTVKLFVQVPSIPLLIDTNGDGQCDEINSDALNEDDRPTQISFQPLSVRGSAYYAATESFPQGDWCVAGGQTMPPAYLCPATMMTYASPQPISGNPPAIYALAPNNGSTGACEGNTWEIGKIVPEGWACLAARVEDNIGNVGVSRPLRVCINDQMGTPNCNSATDTPPDCTDHCTLPPDFPSGYLIVP